MKYCVYILSFFILFSCNDNTENSLDGYWESIGYGNILFIKKDSYTLYNSTEISCTPYKQGDLSKFSTDIQIKNDTLITKKGTSLYYYQRLHTTPKLCNSILNEQQKNDPVFNFEVFAKTIEKHYAFFELNQLNWSYLYSKYRSKINAQTSNVELYMVLDDILNEMNDNHTYLEATDDVYKQIESLNQDSEITETLPEYGDFQIAEMIGNTFIEKNLTKDSWLMQWGTLNDTIGYLQIKSMWLYADLKIPETFIKEHGYVDAYIETFNKIPESDYIEKERKGVTTLMNTVMNDLKDTKLMIVDVRFNGGGQDAVSLEILRHFNDRRKKIATKSAFYSHNYSPEVPIYLNASSNAYLNPVYLLISQQTGSAAEMFAMASLELPHVTRIGSHTTGATSDALEKRLPNGWLFSISNEIYKDLNGTIYENTGVPANYELHYPEDRQTFFRKIANNLEEDKLQILKTIENLQTTDN